MQKKGRENSWDVSLHNFFKGVTSNTSVIHLTTGVVFESDFELPEYNQSEVKENAGFSCWEGGLSRRESCGKSTKIKTNTV